MKKTMLQVLLLVMAATTVLAQAPSLLNYQGIARNTSGTPLASQPIGLRLTVHDGSMGGTIVYQETFNPTTNTLGLYNVAVGGGTVVSGTFAGINWASGAKYLQVEMDATGGTSYANAGTSQLLSVPYALYAANAANATFPGADTNYVPKFTATGGLTMSSIYDNGSSIGIYNTAPSAHTKVEVSGVGSYSGSVPYYQAGIVADSSATAADGCGVYGESGWRGVYGRNPGSASGFAAIGVHGRCEGSTWTGAGYGVLAEAVGTGPTNYGIYAKASGATSTNYAGYFSGNVNIVGSLAKSSGTFLIDHPLDPENKYLYHSFVESPDMMNVYNGNIVTDANGNATVTMPDYFEALNKDYRYQLTTIGQPAQVYVAQEISGNTFQIKSDKPNVKVSWQVTGVRQDKYANAHRVVPEVEKEAKYKGYYLNAAEWGQPQSKSISSQIEQDPSKGNTARK